MFNGLALPLLVLLAMPCAVLADALAGDSLTGDSLAGDALAVQDGEAFAFSWQVTQCGGTLRTEWRESGGKIVASDEVVFGSAGVQRYEILRPGYGHDLQVQREARGFAIRTRTGQGREHADFVAIDSRAVLAGPMLVTYAIDKLAELRAGAVLQIRYLIPERAKVIVLQLRVVAAASGDRAEVEVRAASPWLRPFVPQTVMRFAADGRFVGMTGPLLPLGGPIESPASLHGELQARNRRVSSRCNILGLP